MKLMNMPKDVNNRIDLNMISQKNSADPQNLAHMHNIVRSQVQTRGDIKAKISNINYRKISSQGLM